MSKRITLELIVIICLFCLLVLLAWKRQNEATLSHSVTSLVIATSETAHALSASRRLAAEALAHLADQPELALLLSLEAYRAAGTVEAKASLLEALAHNTDLAIILHAPPTLDQKINGVRSLAFSPDTLPGIGDQLLAAGHEDGRITLWPIPTALNQEVTTIQPLKSQLAGHVHPVLSLAFSPDGRILASSGCAQLLADFRCIEGEVRLWDLPAGQPLGLPLAGHKSALFGSAAVRSVAFSPDGQILASGSEDGTIILWPVSALRDPAIAREPSLGQRLSGHEDMIYSVAFSPDGRWLASGSEDQTIRLWQVAPARPLKPALGLPKMGHFRGVTSVAFSPDSQTLAAGSANNSITLWTIATGQPGQPLTGHTAAILSVAFSPDTLPGTGGQILASGSLDNQLILWDVATGRQIGPPLTGHTDDVWSVAFSPGGQMLASGSGDGTIRLWPASFEAWQSRACQQAQRNLTRVEWTHYVGDEPYRRTCADWPEAKE